MRIKFRTLCFAALFLAALILSFSFVNGSTGPTNEDNTFRLQAPPFVSAAGLPSRLAQGIGTLLDDEAGISAWYQSPDAINLSQVRGQFRTIETETSDYIIGSVPVPDYYEVADAHVYVHRDGWILAYYARTDPISKIVDAEHYTITTTKLKSVVAAVASAAGAPFTDVTYYDFRYPNASHLMLILELGDSEGETLPLDDVLSDTNIAVALTEFSASAPLIKYSQKFPALRAASMPRVSRSMEKTALAADYGEVARKSHILADKLDEAVGARVEFSTGHQVYFDLRNRHAEADDGQLHADKAGMRLINLPSGEACIAPYEGEVEDQFSKTEGTIPAVYEGELVLYQIQENRISEVIGAGPKAAEMRDYFSVDQARRNIAELGLGCNEAAVVTGNVLEDEKVLGMHWAYGRSDHIGGIVGVSEFGDPAHVVHQDIVYAKGGAVDVDSLVLEYEDGTSEEIIKGAEYTIF